MLCLIAPAAASALFSLTVTGNNLAWGTPILARIIWGNSRFQPGAFYTGRFSKAIAIASVIFLVFGITLCMFPPGGPDPNPQSMNYTIVINAAVWGGASLYYFIDAYKWFEGPKITLDSDAQVVEGGQAGEISSVDVSRVATDEDTPVSTSEEKKVY